MKHQWFTVALMCLILAGLGRHVVFAQDDDAVQAEQLEVTITAVQGLVQVRAGQDQPWQKAQAQMKIGEGAEFRTGPRSAVQFMIPPKQVITLDRLGTIKVLQAIKNAGGKVTTDLGMKYGRSRYDIEAAGVEHASTIHMPSVTLAVKGTQIGAQQDFEGRAWSNESCVWFTGTGRPTFQFCTGSEMGSDSDSPGDDRLNQDRVDPLDGGARDGNENNLLDNQPGGNFDNNNLGIDGFGGQDRSGFGDFNGGVELPPEEDIIGDVETGLTNFSVNIYDNGAQDGDVVKVIFNGDILDPYLSLITDENGGTRFDLVLRPGVNIFTAEDVFTPEGGGAVLTGEVEAPFDPGHVGPFTPGDFGEVFNFRMDAIGEQKSLIIVRN